MLNSYSTHKSIRNWMGGVCNATITTSQSPVWIMMLIWAELLALLSRKSTFVYASSRVDDTSIDISTLGCLYTSSLVKIAILFQFRSETALYCSHHFSQLLRSSSWVCNVYFKYLFFLILPVSSCLKGRMNYKIHSALTCLINYIVGNFHYDIAKPFFYGNIKLWLITGLSRINVGFDISTN